MDSYQAETQIRETGRIPALDWGDFNAEVVATGKFDVAVSDMNEAALTIESISLQLTAARTWIDDIPANTIEIGMVNAIETDLRKLTLALYRRCIAAGAQLRDNAGEVGTTEGGR